MSQPRSATDLSYELTLLEPLAGGTESPIATPLYEAIERYVDARVPGAELLPLIGTGFTDSHWVRESFGTVAYGFAPLLHGDPARTCARRTRTTSRWSSTTLPRWPSSTSRRSGRSWASARTGSRPKRRP